MPELQEVGPPGEAVLKKENDKGTEKVVEHTQWREGGFPSLLNRGPLGQALK